MSSLQTWLDALPRRSVDFGWGYWFIVPPLAGARRIRNDVWREFVKADVKPTLSNYAYRRALFESFRLQPQLLFPISLRYAAVPGANYAMRFTLLDMTYPQLPRESKSQRFVATWLATIVCFTLADAPFLWMNRVIRDSRPIELLFRQEGRATNIVNMYRELRSRNQIHGLFDGWRRTLSRGMYLWGPANAVHEVAKTHWSGGPDSFFNQFFGALYGSFIGSLLYGTREFLFVRPVKEWTATDFSDSVVYKTRNIPLRGIYGWRYKTQGMTNYEIISQILAGFKLHSRPWAMTLQLVLFDQLQAISRKKDWGVRAWHWPYETFPDGMRRLHEAFPSLPRPPPLLPPTPPPT